MLKSLLALICAFLSEFKDPFKFLAVQLANFITYNGPIPLKRRISKRYLSRNAIHDLKDDLIPEGWKQNASELITNGYTVIPESANCFGSICSHLYNNIKETGLVNIKKGNYVVDFDIQLSFFYWLTQDILRSKALQSDCLVLW